MRGGHDERPGEQPKQPGAQPDMQAVAMPVEEMIEAPGDEQHAREDAEGVGVDRHAERHHRVDDDGNRRRMPERDRNQRDQARLSRLCR